MAKHKDGVAYLTTKDMVIRFLNRKKRFKNKMNLEQNVPPPMPSGAIVNSLAVVLDAKVEEIIRAENRLAALFLSEPKFIEFKPEEKQVQLGWTYIDGEFFNEFGEKE
jgi:hypothetical protein